MSLFDLLLVSATLLCALVAGFVFAFAVVVMPGIKSLDDRAYLQAFKVMDSIIQNNQPLFVLVWLGSILSLSATAVMSFWHGDGPARLLILTALGIYLLGVQLPTFTINVPLNNKLKQLDLAGADQAALAELARAFNTRWIAANSLRTVLATVASSLLLLAGVMD